MRTQPMLSFRALHRGPPLGASSSSHVAVAAGSLASHRSSCQDAKTLAISSKALSRAQGECYHSRIHTLSPDRFHSRALPSDDPLTRQGPQHATAVTESPCPRRTSSHRHELVLQARMSPLLCLQNFAHPGIRRYGTPSASNSRPGFTDGHQAWSQAPHSRTPKKCTPTHTHPRVSTKIVCVAYRDR